MAKIEDSNSCHTQHGRVIDVTGRTARVEINFSDSACNSCTIANCSRKFPEQHGKTAVVRAAIHPHADIPVAGEEVKLTSSVTTTCAVTLLLALPLLLFITAASVADILGAEAAVSALTGTGAAAITFVLTKLAQRHSTFWLIIPDHSK